MRQIVLAVWRAGAWFNAGSIAEIEPLGSISLNTPIGRQVYVFGWLESEPGVWRSMGGIDRADEAVRMLTSLGLRKLSDLSEPYVLEGTDRRLMFTLTEDDDALDETAHLLRANANARRLLESLTQAQRGEREEHDRPSI